MPETNWGRKETIIWPPHQPIYTIGALLLWVIATGLFVYLRFQFGSLAAPEVPTFRTTFGTVTAGITHPVSKYQLVYVSEYETAGFVSRLTRTFSQGLTSAVWLARHCR